MANDICRSCGYRIRTMAFRGTGFCSVRCEKAGLRGRGGDGTANQKEDRDA